jgi:hypothetical protein
MEEVYCETPAQRQKKRQKAYQGKVNWAVDSEDEHET